VTRYEVSSNPDNNELFENIKAVFNTPSALTPYTVIGGVALKGYNDQTSSDIEKLIKRYSNNDYVDIFYKMMNDIPILSTDFDTIEIKSGVTVDIPIIGKISIDSLSLFVAAIVIGFVDGFNPCAMWVLIFLITMLLNQKNRKKSWVLGITFLFTSALMYFLIMVAWLNIAIQVTMIDWIRIVIGLVAIFFGGSHIIKFIKDSKQKDIGCEVTDQLKKRKLIDKIKKIVVEQKMIIALIGIITLAISVNLVELACSAGLPLLFTQILAYHQLSTVAYFGYILLYILFFLIDDLAIFIIAMITLKVTGISNKYSRISTIVGGVIMFVIGFLLIFFPEIIMFNF
jgi:ABC-type multidrug transport system fused ATPase/permease subunit